MSTELGNLLLNIGCMISNGKNLRKELHSPEIWMLQDHFGFEWAEKFMNRYSS